MGCFNFKCKLPRWLRFFRKKRTKTNKGNSCKEPSTPCSVAKSTKEEAEDVLGSSKSQLHFSRSSKNFGSVTPTQYLSAEDLSLVGMTSRSMSTEFQTAVSSDDAIASDFTSSDFSDESSYSFRILRQWGPPAWGPNVSPVKIDDDGIRQSKSEVFVSGKETYKSQSRSLPNLSLGQSGNSILNVDGLDDVIYLY